MNIYGLIIGQSHQPEGVLFYQQLTHYAICKAPNGVPDNWEGFQTGEHLQLRMEEIEAMNTPQSREVQLETLTTAFDTFVGLVEDETQRNELQLLAKALFYDNRSVMIGHVVNGGSDLKDFFANYEQGWLDIRASEESPTPREYALNLLN